MNLKRWVQKVWAKEESFVVFSSLVFYLSLYFNINNRTLLGIFVFFFVLFWKRFKNPIISFSLLYLLFLPFGKGKTLDFVLIPAYVLNTDSPYVYGLTITFADLAFAGILFLVLKENLTGRAGIKSAVFRKTDLYLFVFLLFVFLSILFSEFKIVSFLAFVKLFRLITVYFLIQRVLKERLLIKFIPLVFASSLFFEGAWSSLQFLLQRPLGKAIEPVGAMFGPYGLTTSEDQFFFRAQGTFEHPNTLGSFLVIFLAFFCVVIFNFKDKWEQKIIFFGVLLGTLGLVFSASRASWIVFLFTALLIVFVLKKRNLLVIPPFAKKWLALITISVFFLFPFVILPRLGHLFITLAEKGGVYYRTYLIEKAWYLALESSLGIGLATFPAVLVERFGFFTWPTPVHNLWFEILTETGIFSLIFFLLFLIFVYKRFFLSLKQTSNKNSLLLRMGSFFATVGFLGVAQFYPFFWSSGIFEYFWLFLGIMVY